MKKRSKDQVQTPLGIRHISCVQETRRVDMQHPGPVNCQQVPKDLSVLRALSPNGWKEAATCAPVDPLGSMHVKFLVPPAPLESGAIIYLFPGAEDAYLTTILQPVLQWGNNGVFGGDHWTLSCWHASTSGLAFYSPVLRCEPGQTIDAAIRVVGCSQDSCDWVVEAVREGPVPETTGLEVLNMPRLMLFLVAGALEAYPEDPCCGSINPEQYPAGGETEFTNIEILDLSGERFNPIWSAAYGSDDPGCLFHVDIGPQENMVRLRY